ncbi:MAG: sensor histidine kinase [Candidatus Eisenbacteria bacterium]|nr:ATP-binding protein [Candidatus Eisenbacteria bacterium]
MKESASEVQVLIVSDSKEQIRRIESALRDSSSPELSFMPVPLARLDDALLDRAWDVAVCAPPPLTIAPDLLARLRAVGSPRPVIGMVEGDAEEIAARTIREGGSGCLATSRLDQLPHLIEEALREDRTRRDERRRIEQEKIESIRELASGVSHEVKNPLTVILMGIDFLSRKTRSQDEEMLAVLKDMGDAVRRVNEVILGLRELAAPQAIELRNESIVDVLERALRQVRHEFEKAGITVRREIDPSIAPFPLDGTKMEQAFVNLLLSSSQAMPQGGTIRIRILERGEGDPGSGAGGRTLQIEIEDDGSSVPEQEIEHLFDPFYASKTAGRGTGVALTVVKRIVEMHGGSVRLQNRREGGVQMTLSLSSPGQEEPAALLRGRERSS